MRSRKTRFRFAVDTGPLDDRNAATMVLAKAASLIARHYGVCPLCLTYALAAATERAEDTGKIQHLDDLEEEVHTLQ